MAKQNSDTFQRFTKDLKQGRIKSPVLLHGDEHFLVRWGLEQLTAVYVNEATKTLDRSDFVLGEAPAHEIIAACETFPMFSQKKMVVVEDCISVFKRDMGHVSDEEIEALTGFMEDLPEHLLLVFTVSETPDDRKGSKTSLYKTIEKKGTIYDFGPLDKSDLIKFIQKRFRSAGKEVSGYQLNQLATGSGYLNKDVDYTLYNLENDIAKILHANPGTNISDESIEELLSDTLEHGVFGLLDAISANQKANALGILHQLTKSGQSPFALLSLIIGQLEVMVAGKEFAEKGYAVEEISKQTGIHEFRLKKALRASNNYTVKDLRRILLLALSVEDQIKSGYMEDVLALEMFIAEI